MCNQSVGLVAGELEARGIATVCVALVRSIAERVRPPRALVVPFPFGAPLGAEGAERQRDVVRQALALLAREGPGPVLEEWRGVGTAGGAGA